jgi:hypothetical protein
MKFYLLHTYNIFKGIYLWFHTYGRTRKSAEKFKDVKKWTARKVLAVEAEEDLKQTIRESTGGWNGSNSGKADNQKAFGTYQVELSKIWNQQSEDDRSRLEEIARLWNETGPPAIQQAKCVLTYSSGLSAHQFSLETQRRLPSTFGHFVNR